MDKNKFDPATWQRLDELLDQALELEGSERAAFVQQAPESLRAHLSDLLARTETTSVDQLVSSTIKSTAWDLPETDPMKAEITRWKLRRELGSGGTAQVFYAERQEHDYIQRAAIKILWPYRSDQRFQQRFLRERGILAQMEHPNIARFLDGGMLADGRPWLAMEYVDGIAVTRYCKEHELSVRQRLNLFLQICDAVEYSHEKLIVHRDIKPQNILVDQSGHARLLDFGIARDFDAADQNLTRDNMVTLQYASPEQIKGEQANVASDVYQLGLLLYEMLAGCRPLVLKDLPMTEAIEAICHQQPARLSTHSPGVSADLEAVVACALSKDPAHRYRSAAYLANDVQNVLKGLPIRAKPSTRWYRTRLFVRRNAVAVSVVSIAMVGLLVAGVITIKFAKDARQQAINSATTQRMMLEVFKQIDPMVSPDEATLSSALVTALPGLKEELAELPEIRYPVFSELAELLISVGEYELALEAMQEAFSAVEDRLKTNPERLAIVASMTRLQVSRGQYDEALELARLQGVETANLDNAQQVVMLWTPLIEAYRQKGDLDGGAELVDRIAGIVDIYGIEDLNALGKFSNLRALLASSQGDMETAEHYSREAANYAEQAGDLREQSVLLHNLALNLGRQGRFDESETLFLESLEITANRADDHPLHAHHLANYAGLLYRTQRVDEALLELDNAIAVLETSSQPAWLARAWRDKAFYAVGAGRFEMAAPAFVTYYRNNVDTFGSDSRQHMHSQFQLARLGHMLGFHSISEHWMVELVGLFPTIDRIDGNLELARMMLERNEIDRVPSYLSEISDANPGGRLEAQLRYACTVGDQQGSRQLIQQIDELEPSVFGAAVAGLWARYVEWRLASQGGHDAETYKIFIDSLESAFPGIYAAQKWQLLQAAVESAGENSSLPEVLATEWQRLNQSRAAAREIYSSETDRLVDYTTASLPAVAQGDRPQMSCL